jgi:hypothetical protein
MSRTKIIENGNGENAPTVVYGREKKGDRRKRRQMDNDERVTRLKGKFQLKMQWRL